MRLWSKTWCTRLPKSTRAALEKFYSPDHCRTPWSPPPTTPTAPLGQCVRSSVAQLPDPTVGQPPRLVPPKTVNFYCSHLRSKTWCVRPPKSPRSNFKNRHQKRSRSVRTVFLDRSLDSGGRLRSAVLAGRCELRCAREAKNRGRCIEPTGRLAKIIGRVAKRCRAGANDRQSPCAVTSIFY